jgi:hypothetical protein
MTIISDTNREGNTARERKREGRAGEILYEQSVETASTRQNRARFMIERRGQERWIASKSQSISHWSTYYRGSPYIQR